MSLSVRQFLQESNLGDPSHGLRALFPDQSVIRLRSLVVSLILQTNVVNPPHDSSATWSNNVCQNKQFLADDPPKWQWTPVLTPTDEKSQLGDSVGISGWAITAPNQGISGFEVPFNHPFDNDWEFYIAPDRGYENLLAQNNFLTGSNLDPDYRTAINHTNDLIATGGLNPDMRGVLGVETDQGLVPPDYRVQNDGERVVVFGRWIVDCGHKDFHTEIHPPLLLAVARPVSGTATLVAVPLAAANATFVSVISRPFLVLQEFTVDNKALRAHLLEEIGKLAAFPFPTSWHIEAHVKLLLPPFAGTQHMSFFVRPPKPRQSPTDLLLLDCHFTVRSGVTVEVTTTPFPDEVQVLITMNEADYKSAPLQPKLPPKHSKSIQITDLRNKEVLADASGLAAWDSIINPFIYEQLAAGIEYDLYDAPQAQSVHDSENGVSSVLVEQNMGTIAPAPFSVGDDQPFPIYGSLTLKWG